MEKSQALQEAIKKFLEENAAKRRELEEIAAPYKKLIEQIESEQKELDEARAQIVVGYNGRTLNPLHWRKSQYNDWTSKELRRLWYTLQYRIGRQDKSATIHIEARPELKKYKFTVTTTAVEKWNGGKCFGIFGNYFRDDLNESERYGYKQTSEASADEKMLLVERWQCKTLEEAEAKAAELMQAINRIFRSTKNYKKLIDMVSAEIDQLEHIEIQP